MLDAAIILITIFMLLAYSVHTYKSKDVKVGREDYVWIGLISIFTTLSLYIITSW